MMRFGMLIGGDVPEDYRDAPISLQCIGKKYEEEAVIK